MRALQTSLVLAAVVMGAVAASAQVGEERTIVLDPAPVQGVRALYDQPNPDNDYAHINGFASLTVLEGPAGDAFWTAGTAACIKAKLTAQNTYLIDWNKPGGGCPWVGLGVGWDQWSGKNLGPLLDVAAIELVVRLPQGQPVRSFPWAFGLEDYSGRQAWMGMSADRILNGPVGPDYRAIRLPLTAFNWREMKTDPSNIKQFLLQFGKIQCHLHYFLDTSRQDKSCIRFRISLLMLSNLL
jgi:hypothetical protein